VWFHVLQGVGLWALQVWASAQYAQAYSLLLGITSSLLELMRAGLQPLHRSRGVPGAIADVCTIWHWD
jgi:hypothetical protein